MPNSSIISHTIPNLVGIQMYYIPPEVVDPLATPIYQNWESNIIIDEVGNRTQYDASTNPDNVLLYSWNMEYQEAVEPEAPKNYFYIKNEDSIQISILYSNDNNQYVNYKMQTDNEWQTCSAGQRIQINPSEICQIKRNAFEQAGNNNPHAGAFNNATGLHSVGGNIMSLLYDDDFEDKVVLPSVTQGTALYHFDGLFSNNSSLISVSNLSLPATTLSYNCYFQMFYGCTSLVDAPELPATTLTSNCYNQMFSGCSSLTTAPELPATALTEACYFQMFYGCTNLNYIKAMFTTAPGNDYFQTSDWLNGVSSTGTFVMNSAATWNPADYRGASGIPYNWTVQTASS